MKILAIDPSLNATGLAFPDRSTRLLKASKFSGTQRLVDLRDRLREIVVETNPQVAVIEGCAYGIQSSSVLSLAEWAGVLRVLLWEMDVEIVEVNPKHLKMWQLGKAEKKRPKGEESKPRGKDAAMLAWAAQSGIAFPDNNQADAWSLGAMAYAYIGEPWLQVEANQLAALGCVAWPECMHLAREAAWLDRLVPPAPKAKKPRKKVAAGV